MPIPIIPIIALGAAAYVVSERSAQIKRKKQAAKRTAKQKAQEAYEWFQREWEARAKRKEDSQWRVLAREPGVVFRPTDTYRRHAKIGNEIVVRVGTKDRNNLVLDNNNRLYPISSSDDISYNYYRVFYTAENEYDFDDLGNTIQKEVQAVKVYDELPGPRRIAFVYYPHRGELYYDMGEDDYACASCSYQDAALLEFSEGGEVIGLATFEEDKDSVEALKKRFPRPGDLTKTQRLRRIWIKFTTKQVNTIKEAIGEEDFKKLEKVILEEGSDKEMMNLVYEISKKIQNLPPLEQADLALEARSVFDQKTVSQIIEIVK